MLQDGESQRFQFRLKHLFCAILCLGVYFAWLRAVGVRFGLTITSTFLLLFVLFLVFCWAIAWAGRALHALGGIDSMKHPAQEPNSRLKSSKGL